MWKTIDDATGKPRGVIEITEKDGVYSGRLVKSLVETAESKPKVCDKCTDARKDQPVIGMTLLTGLRKTGDNEYTGGEILDPEDRQALQVQDGAGGRRQESSTCAASSASA